MGVEHATETGWKVGAAFGYDDLGEMRFDHDRARADGDAVHGGVAVAKSFGDRGQGVASVSLSGGVQTVELIRSQSVFVTAIGTSNYKTDYYGTTGTQLQF